MNTKNKIPKPTPMPTAGSLVNYGSHPYINGIALLVPVTFILFCLLLWSRK